MIYLLDTNVCIQFLRQRHARLVQRVESHRPSELRLCSIVVAELFFGTERSRDPSGNRAKVDFFLKPYMSLAFDDHAARKHAKIRRELEIIGMPIGPSDSQIAAIALVHDLTLVTHNTSEFGRVPGLHIEDWETS